MKNNELDQFYTQPSVCKQVVEKVCQILKPDEDTMFIEPSAGTGNFLTALNDLGFKHIIAYDLEPKCVEIKQADYLKTPIVFNEHALVIGNPPFGYKGQLAVQFINHGLQQAPAVAFIVPYTFRRYSVQKQINPHAKLIYEIALPKNSFIANNKVVDINTVLQIWTLKDDAVDLRKAKPILKIPELTTYIYNNTEQTLKYFDKKTYQWDFAVVRQGYYDYHEKIYDPKQLKKERQYFFVKINDEKVRAIVYQIDFTKLAALNTTTPGFSTSDFIQEFLKLKNNNR